MNQQLDIVLGTESRYKRGLFERFRVPFRTAAPDIDESRRAHETPAAYVRRLALSKAQAVAQRHPADVVIGGDQTAALDDTVLGKPGTVAAACQQLKAMSGRTVCFYTAIATIHRSGTTLVDHDETRVRFRTLSDAEIARYVELEQPLDCAGAFKSEGLGITLFDTIESEDPTALIGLPLIRLARQLRTHGLALP